MGERIKALPDFRSYPSYTMDCIVFAGVSLFLFKRGSRNSMNLDRESEQFLENHKGLFGAALPHMDTVSRVLKELSEEHLESIRKYMLKELLQKRVLHKYRYLDRYFIIAIDGTGVYSYTEEPYPGCPYKERNGKKYYQQPVLEAKLVCSNGFSLSIGSEWIVNEDGATKQDCETKAFHRLAEQLKKDYSRLPICLVLDGLYANGPIMEKVLEKRWQFIIVWKEGNLKSVWEQLGDQRLEGSINKTQSYHAINPQKGVNALYEYTSEALVYQQKEVYMAQLTEEHISIERVSKTKKIDKTTRFVFLTSIKITSKNIRPTVKCGRMRWKIENEGFNAQKNGGMALSHKYVRNNLRGMKNYYLCMQIAHIIEQLSLLAKAVVNIWKKGKMTIKKLWENLMSLLKEHFLDWRLIAVKYSNIRY
ncbi:MAG: hypothetical protein GY754_30755 [bacterium]|nr:hypothetical protein [bacterium]